MDLFALTRRLVDIESTTPHEGPVGDFLCAELTRRGFDARKMPVEGDRNNVLATWSEQPRPEIVFSTHLDTVPPFIPSSEDATRIYGRGSCDAKGIIAAQVMAAERLRGEAFSPACYFWWARSGTRSVHWKPTGIRSAPVS
jgi:acetylornithine deacetylase